MRKYNVYGIGNALVDMVFEVEDQFFADMNIEKGLMTLVDEQKQNELLDALSSKNLQKACGGSAANSMIGVSQFGGKSFYSCKVSNDDYGTFYTEDLKNEGVTSNLGPQRKDGVTGKCLVMVTPDAERTMNSFLGITETFSKEELVLEELKNSNYLYIEGYLVTSETGREAAITAKKVAEENNVKTALTFSDPSMAKYFNEGLKEMLGTGVDLLFCNEEEAMLFTGKDNFEESISDLKKVAKTLVVTVGPKGAYYFDGKEEGIVETSKVKAIDTNGAGDLFAGAFLYGINNDLSYKESAGLACKAASLLVTQSGPRLRKEQVENIKKEF